MKGSMRSDARKSGRKVKDEIEGGAKRLRARAVKAVHSTENRSSELGRRVKAAAHRADVKVRKAVRR